MVTQLSIMATCNCGDALVSVHECYSLALNQINFLGSSPIVVEVEEGEQVEEWAQRVASDVSKTISNDNAQRSNSFELNMCNTPLKDFLSSLRFFNMFIYPKSS